MISAVFSPIYALPIWPLSIFFLAILASIFKVFDWYLFHSKPPENTLAYEYWRMINPDEAYLDGEDSGFLHHQSHYEYSRDAQQQFRTQQQQPSQQPASSADIKKQIDSITESDYFNAIFGHK